MLTDNTQKYLLGFKGYMIKSNTCFYATVLCLIPEKCLRAPVKNTPKKNGKWTGSWLRIYFAVCLLVRTVTQTDLSCNYILITVDPFHVMQSSLCKN